MKVLQVDSESVAALPCLESKSRPMTALLSDVSPLVVQFAGQWGKSFQGGRAHECATLW